MFAAIVDTYKPYWSFFYAPESDFEDMLENSLPEFWSSGLSKAYADIKITNEIKVPRRITYKEKIRKVRELRDRG